jgi:hypothetical protein
MSLPPGLALCISKRSVVAPSIEVCFGLTTATFDKSGSIAATFQVASARTQPARARARDQSVFVPSDSTHAYYRIS